MTAPSKAEHDAAEAAMNDDNLRDALTAGDGDNAVVILKNMGITFSNPTKAAALIGKIDWKDLNALEGLLGRKLEDREAHPLSA